MKTNRSWLMHTLANRLDEQGELPEKVRELQLSDLLGNGQRAVTRHVCAKARLQARRLFLSVLPTCSLVDRADGKEFVVLTYDTTPFRAPSRNGNATLSTACTITRLTSRMRR